jgi:2'-5' RNA ligase
MNKQLFFIAILPPVEIRAEVTQIQQYFADRYGSRAALRLPPHITLQPPFKWETEALSNLEQCLQEFARERSPVPIKLSGFGAFVPRVIYINVSKTPELLACQQELTSELETSLAIADSAGKKRPYAPHMTVAYRDLTRSNFHAAWPEFKSKSLGSEFAATHLTLLIHDGKRWKIASNLVFQTSNLAITPNPSSTSL